MERLEGPERTLMDKVSPHTLIDLRTEEFARRFWRRVHMDFEAKQCWPWARKPDKDGYGRLSVLMPDGTRRNTRAHRVAAAMTLANYDEALVVRHTCDNPICCNPWHLQMGTQADNIADRDQRQRRAPPRGESNGRAKLTAEQVRAIRESPVSALELAPQLGVSRSIIYQIRSGRRWRDRRDT
jgi:hypothetical protein